MPSSILQKKDQSFLLIRAAPLLSLWGSLQALSCLKWIGGRGDGGEDESAHEGTWQGRRRTVDGEGLPCASKIYGIAENGG